MNHVELNVGDELLMYCNAIITGTYFFFNNELRKITIHNMYVMKGCLENVFPFECVVIALFLKETWDETICLRVETVSIC